MSNSSTCVSFATIRDKSSAGSPSGSGTANCYLGGVVGPQSILYSNRL